MSTERDDLVETLRRHRGFLTHTVEGLTDEQARLSPTASELSLGGLIKHVASTEKQWADFIVDGSQRGGPEIDWENVDWSNPPEAVRQFHDGFRMLGPGCGGGTPCNPA